MISFFINGSMKIIKYDYLPENNTIDFYEYEMRFLTETSHEANVDINITPKGTGDILINFDGMHNAYGVYLDGVLGYEFLRQKRTIINYKKEKLYFVDFPNK